MADMAITGAIHKPITTYAAPTAAEQQGAAATQTAEKTQKSLMWYWFPLTGIPIQRKREKKRDMRVITSTFAMIAL